MRQNLWFRKLAEKVFPGFSCIFLLLNPTLILAQPPGDGWAIKFTDNFEGKNLDPDKWNSCYWWADSNGCTNGGSGDLQWYRPENAIVQNGILRLRAEKRQSNGFDYTSGMISSHDNYSFRYGYVEMRAKLPKGKGLWATFWLLSQNRNWPPELDIAEYLGHQTNQVNITIHYDDNGHESSPGWWTGPDFSADYHTFGVLWEPDKIIWYVDGLERRRYTEIKNIPTEPMYLVASLALGSAWTDTPPDSSTPFPAYLDIDYIKVWQHN